MMKIEEVIFVSAGINDVIEGEPERLVNREERRREMAALRRSQRKDRRRPKPR